MLGFKYEYSTPYNITANITKIVDYSLFDILVLISGILLIIFFVFIIIPYTNIFFLTRKERKEEKKKRQIIKKIALQKDLEDIVAKELKNKTSAFGYES